jgi:hypothetical protein
VKYRAEYTLRFERDPDPAIVGESIEVREGLCQFTSVDVKRRIVHIDVIVPVETDGLTLGTGPKPLDGSEPQRGVVVPEQAAAAKIAQGLIRVLAFARGHAVHLSVRGSELLPETDHDRDVLVALGADQPLRLLKARLSIQTAIFSTLTSETLAHLLEREVGLALYNDALSLSQPVARFREFWRVLEAAFGEDGDKLVALLSAFPPAQELGYTATELKDLLVLRGRASHAQSSAGLVEYERVNNLVSDKVERIRCLAAQVLLTKKTWGLRGLEVERLGRLRSTVQADGTPVIYRDFATASDDSER